MNKYIFLTDEGYTTYQPNSTNDVPDCENAQVLGIVETENEETAFKNLLNENMYLKDSNFCNAYCYKLSNNFTRTDFRI